MEPAFVITLAGIAVLLIAIIGFRLQAFLSLILASLVVSVLTAPASRIGYYLTEGFVPAKAVSLASATAGLQVANDFGEMAGKIGVLIGLASIVATCLKLTGAADRITGSILASTGERRAPVALTLSAYSLGIPVFSDTVLYLMLPLARSLSLLLGRHYLLCILGVSLAIANTHVMIPPSPGPLFMASKLGIPLGTMILAGFIFSAPVCLFGYAVAVRMDRRMALPTPPDEVPQTVAAAAPSDRQLPPLWLAVLPIILPLVLISAGSIHGMVSSEAGTGTGRFLDAIGQPNVALAVTALLSLATLAWRHRWSTQAFGDALGPALHTAGSIVLIIGAGGAFGISLQKCGIGPALSVLADTLSIGILPLAFLITVLFRTVTGSATVAMLTTSSIMASVVAASAPGFNLVYLAMTIGFGSKIFPWLNDAFFWLLIQVGGLTVPQTIRSWSILNSVMGLFGFMLVYAASWLFPLG